MSGSPRSRNACSPTKFQAPEKEGDQLGGKGGRFGGSAYEDQGEKQSESFYLMIWEKQSWAVKWMSLESLESSSQLAEFTDVCEKLPRLQTTSNTSLI